MDVFAMTQSGVQVEVSVRPAKGALELTTPFGTYFTATDPVAVVVERRRDRSWAASLSALPDSSLMSTIKQFHDNGQVSAQLELARVVVQRGRAEEVRAVLRSFEEWGARFDPVPSDLKRQERVEWLWEQVQEVEGMTKLLFAGRLAEEVQHGANGVGERQFTLVTLRRAVEREDDPLVRRAAILVSEAQLMDDSLFGALIQHRSLYGHPLVRDRAARTAVVLRPAAAREYWVRALFRAEDSLRGLAATHLADELPNYAPKPFAILLATVGKRAPARFKFSDFSVQVVTDRKDPLSLRQLELAFRSGAGGDDEMIENSSVVKVVRLPDDLRLRLLRKLNVIADDDRERTVEEWIEWYEKRKVGP